MKRPPRGGLFVMGGRMRTAAWMLSSCFACVCAAAPPDPQVVLSVDWQDCPPGKQEPYFTLDFLPDGAVTYEGKNEIREKGTRVVRIDSRHVRQLVRSATKAVNLGAPRAENPPYVMRPIFCLNVKVVDGDSISRAPSHQRTGRGRSSIDNSCAIWTCSPGCVPRAARRRRRWRDARQRLSPSAM